MPIVEPVPIPAAPPAPQRNDPATFEERNDAAVEYQFNTLPAAINQQSEAAYQNALATAGDAVATAADRVQTGLDRVAVEAVGNMIAPIADDIPVVAANDANITTVAKNIGAINKTIGLSDFKGAWEFLTGPLTVPSSVMHGGEYWQLLVDIPDVTASEPGVSADWAIISFSTYGIGDIKYGMQEPDEDGWVESGKVYLKSAYPALFDITGTIPDIPLAANFDFRSAGSTIDSAFITESGRIIFARISTGANNVMYSDDRGETVETVSSSSPPRVITLNSKSSFAAQHIDGAIVAVGQGSNATVSTNNGDTWSAMEIASGRYPVSFVTNAAGTVVYAFCQGSGNVRAVYRSTNSALSGWTMVGSTFNISDGFICAGRLSDTVIACGIGGNLCISRDGGSSFSVEPFPFGAPLQIDNFDGIPFVVSNQGVFFPDNPEMTSWTAAPSSGIPNPTGVARLAPFRYLIYSQSSSLVYITDDGFRSWSGASLYNSQTSNARVSYATLIPGDAPRLLLVSSGNNAEYALSDPGFTYDPDTMFYVPRDPLPQTEHYKSYVRATL